MGHFGFSYIGCIYLLLLFIPNGIWAKYKPKDYDALTGREPKFLRLLEGLGQALTTCCSLVFADFNPKGWSLWSLWLIGSLCCMALYETGWIRYFAGGHTLRDMYRPLWGVPLPLASLPVLAFLLLGVYGRALWMVVAALPLGVGHIGIHALHWRRIKSS
ncbi:MAG: hypothetical protein HFE86_08485 [Clostridiales bacterium]|nr:hypothetical protein [Clostridiales bacterium]